jgi:hypothetical protein
LGYHPQSRDQIGWHGSRQSNLIGRVGHDVSSR